MKSVEKSTLPFAWIIIVVVVVGSSSHPNIRILIDSPYSLSSLSWRMWRSFLDLEISQILTRSFARIRIWWTTLAEGESHTAGQKHLPQRVLRQARSDKSGFISMSDVWSMNVRLVYVRMTGAALFRRFGLWDYVIM